MKNYVVKISVLIIILLSFLSPSAFPQTLGNGFTIVKSDDDGLVISYKPVIQSIDTIITTDGTLTLLPKIVNGHFGLGDPGTPANIVVDANISVPMDTGFTLDKFEYIGYKNINGLIAPFPDLVKNGSTYTDQFTYQPSLYSKYSNASLTHSIVYGGVARNNHIAMLKIIAAKYNPVTKQIEIPSEIIFYVSWSWNKKQGYVMPSEDIPKFTINNPIPIHYDKIANRNPSVLKKKPLNTLVSTPKDAIKIEVSKEGVYKIDASALSSQGVNLKKEEIATIKIYGNGGYELSETVTDAQKNVMNEIPIITKTNSDGNLESIVFYGIGTNGFKPADDGTFHNYFSHYSDKNYYILTWGEQNGLRAVPQSLTDKDAVSKPTTYIEKLFFKEELSCALAGGSGRVWFGGSVFPRVFNNVLNNLDRTGKVNYRFYFAHSSSADGVFSVTDNGVNVGKVPLGSTTNESYLDSYGDEGYFELNASDIYQDNRSVMNINYSNPNLSTSSSYFNWYEIHYPRSFVPIDNQLGFWTKSTDSLTAEYSINGFSGDIYGWEVTNAAKPVLIKNDAVTGGMFIFKTDRSKNSPKRFYISSSLQTPSLSKVSLNSLREYSDSADVILITNTTLISSAENYKAYREANSDLKVKIVTTDDIYNEFNSGTPDPTAIRDFVAFAFKNWVKQPRYVLLWGDGHYDYKNITTKNPSMIPPYESFESINAFRADYSFTTDDYYVMVNGNDPFIDLSIGRMPITDDETGNWMVEKIKTYENNSSDDNWRSFQTLVADDSPTDKDRGDGNTHTYQSEILANQFIPQYMQERKIYMPEYPSENSANSRRKPRVTQDIIDYSNNAGTLLINWVGHGNPRVWAHEEIFDRDKTIPQLRNLSKLFFNTAATCDFARFDMPDIRSGAEELLLSKIGGSIGEFSATRLVISYDNSQINQKFHSYLYSRSPITKEYYRLGDVMLGVKLERANSNDRKYNLFGDPTMRLLFPYFQTRVDKISNVNVATTSDTAKLKAWSKITLEGSVISPVDSSVVSDFNGEATLAMFDADYGTVAIDVDGTNHYINKYGGILNKSRLEVKNGKFTASFYLPEDLSFTQGPARLYVYANSNDKRSANGICRNIVLTGVDTMPSNVQPPELSVYLDSITFQPQDIVSNTPLLIVRARDEYGINATGAGIGHRIEAWIDDNINSIDLTDKVNALIDDPKTIEARQLLYNLSAGLHHVKIRAWNIFNKFAIAETDFQIGNATDGVIIRNLLAYPNPFTDKVNIRFQHNQSLPFRAVLKIYNSIGQLAKEINKDISSLHTAEIQWDATNTEGNKLAQGLYYYQLELYGQNGTQAFARGGIAYIK